MPNPIHILHLSDWHLSQHKINKYNKLPNNNFEEEIFELSLRVKKFLKQQGKKHIDIVCITGDMTDRDNFYDNSHEGTAKIVKSFLKHSEHPLINESSKIYCSPGNHDFDNKERLKFYTKNLKNINQVFTTPEYANYILADYYEKELKNHFQRYQDFCNKIEATNSHNPFNDHAIIKTDQTELFISWFNSSWLCLINDYWAEIIDSKKTIEDRGYITAGQYTNHKIYEAYKEFKEDTSNRFKFSLSLFHHYPRLLNHFDMYDSRLGVEASFCDPYKEIAHKLAEKNYPCFYNHCKDYNLVLNGHTHGKLYDFPFSTTTGFLTPQSSVLENYIDLIEIDLYRGYYIIYGIPLKKGKPILKDFRVFNDQKAVEISTNTYSKKDLYFDWILNPQEGVSETELTEENILYFDSYNFELNSIKKRLKFVTKTHNE